MSNWTHVAGIVRVDSFRGLFGEDEPNFTKVFGKEVEWDSPREDWNEAYEHPEKYLPRGSEGSLTMSVWTNPDLDRADAYTVSIFGDLRDHDDPDAIVEWFKEKCAGLWVRNACICVNNEWNGMRSWVYKSDETEQ